MINSIDKLLKIKDAAPYIGRGRSTIYALIRSGELKAVRVGGRVFIEENELKRFRQTSVKPVEFKPMVAA